MASDALFLALANAKSQPSHALRAVQSAGQAGQDIMGGYMGGKEIQQKLQQYKLLATPLGSMYSDPSQIPFGLGPQHTVKDLLTLAPAMENYVPGNLIRGAAGAYGANVGGGGGAPPPPVSAPPIPGAANPALPPGTSMLNADQGTGAGGGANLPPGTPPAILGNTGASPSPGMTMDIPPGGMGMKGFQNVVLPALKAGQEERHFNANQTREASQFATAQQNEKNRTMAGETAKIAPSLTEAGTIQDDINALLPLYKGYSPTPFLGTTLAHLAAKSGTTSFGGPTVQAGKQIEQITPALAAKVNYLLNKRFNSGEAAMLQAQVVPNATDNEQSAMQKIGNLRRLTAVMQGGDINALQMVANSIAGRQVSPALPSSSGQAPPNSGTGDPLADAAIQKVQSSSLDPNTKQARINGIMAKARAKRPYGQ
jgi:hypothetical protein